ncbi:MAG: TRAP transporter substrate-binding protein DctP [Actinobacteria bacterium]|nr:TRAP transporter substrate-binding protein DctP [Actinomycetota bacterium]
MAMLLSAGCTATPVDRAGGSAARDVRVLTFGQFGVTPGPALEAWAAEVKALSGGALRIEFKNEWQANRVDYETATVEDVRAGTVDIAMVGARVFDRVGVTSFQALLAPMLVDSQALQARVFAAGIPDRMAEHLEPSGVVSLGTFPGPMRKMLGVNKSLVRPSDFAGAVIGIQDSELTARALTALGAVPKPVGPGASLDGLDGYEQQLGSIVGNQYADAAKYVTANLDLWPRPQVIITSPNLRDSLPAAERRALESAVVETRPVAEQSVQKEDGTSAALLCRDGMKLPPASARDLRAFDRAFAPLLDELAGEPATGAWLEQIRSLKAQVAAAPDTHTCEGAVTEPVASSILDGTYERVQIRGEAVPGCPPATDFTDPRSALRLVLRNGTVREYWLSSAPGAQPDLGWVGSYQVFRDRIEFTERSTVIQFTVAWSLKGKRLNLTDLRPFVCGDANVWVVRPWVRVP